MTLPSGSSPAVAAEYHSIDYPASFRAEVYPIRYAGAPDGRGGRLSAWLMVACFDHSKYGCFKYVYFFDGFRYVGQNHDSGQQEAVTPSGNSIAVTTKLWNKGDNHCCATGAQYVSYYQWTGTKLVRRGPHLDPRSYAPPAPFPAVVASISHAGLSPEDAYLVGLQPFFAQVRTAIVQGKAYFRTVTGQSAGSALQAFSTAQATSQLAQNTLHGDPDPPTMADVDATLNSGTDTLIQGLAQASQPGDLLAGVSTFNSGLAKLNDALRVARQRGYSTKLFGTIRGIVVPTPVPTSTPPPSPVPTSATTSYFALVNEMTQDAQATFNEVSNAQADETNGGASTSQNDIDALNQDAQTLQTDQSDFDAVSPPPGYERLQQDTNSMLQQYIKGLQVMAAGYTLDSNPQVSLGNAVYNAGQREEFRVLHEIGKLH